MTEESIQLLLHELISAFIEKPEALTVDVMHEGDKVVFEVTPHRDDIAMLLGKRGDHLRSLQFVVWRIGKAQGRWYVFNMPKNDERGGSLRADFKAEAYDPELVKGILLEIMKALELPVHVGVEADGKTDDGYLFFVFTITAMEYGSRQILIAPVAFGKGTIILTEALGTLLRAIARNSGVVFQLEIAKA
jgi:predicted RNA-binding protein YlqC (UPF0109 family)